MRKLLGILAAAMLLAALGACGGGDDDSTATDADTTTESEDDFVTQGNAICAEGSMQIATVALEEGYEQSSRDSAERVTAVAEVRQDVLDQLKTLEPPADQVETFDSLIENRQAAIDLAKLETKAILGGDRDEIKKATAATQEKIDAGYADASDLGLTNCAAEISDEDADAAVSVLTEFSTTSDAELICKPSGLATEAFIEGGFGDYEKCKAVQRDIEDELPTDIEVKDVTGVDGVVATVAYEDVGGKYDGDSWSALLYTVDGEWKVYSVNPA